MANNDGRRLSELTIGDAKRIIVYTAATLLAALLFILLVGKVLVALLLGVVAGAFLVPVQEWLEKRLRGRAPVALVSIAMIVVPLAMLTGYAWYELRGYSNLVHERREEIITGISGAVERYVAKETTRAGLETAFAEAVTRSGEAIQGLRERSAILLASAAVFFFTVFYVLTQRGRLTSYIKLRVPGEYLPLYEKLAANIGGALRGALLAVSIDQALKGIVIFVLNVVFGVPLAAVLGIVAFLIGFFPLLGEWAVYIPVSVYLIVFRDQMTGGLIYLAVGVALSLASTLLLRPRLAAYGARRFNFYWMLIALVTGVLTFGIPGIVLGPAILGFAKAIADTLFGDVRYETSLLKSEFETKDDEAGNDDEAGDEEVPAKALAETR